MATDVIIPENLRVRGTLIPAVLTIPSGTVTNAGVAAGADIDITKVRHLHNKTWGQPNSASTTETRVMHVASLPGQVLSVKAGSIAIAIGNSTVTVDVKKNGTSVLTAVITLDNTNTARVAEAGTISGSQDDLVAGDILETVITATIGTGTLPTGVFVNIEVDEDGV